MAKNKKRKPTYKTIRAPLPRQTGGMHKPEKGGSYDRNQAKREVRRQIQEG